MPGNGGKGYNGMPFLFAGRLAFNEQLQGWLQGAYKLKFTVSTVAPTRLTLLIFNTITSVLRTFGPIPLVVLIKETLKLSVYAFYPSA